MPIETDAGAALVVVDTIKGTLHVIHSDGRIAEIIDLKEIDGDSYHRVRVEIIRRETECLAREDFE